MRIKPLLSFTVFCISVLAGVTLYLCVFLNEGVLFPFLLVGCLAGIAGLLYTRHATGKWPRRIHRFLALGVVSYLVLELSVYALLSIGWLRTDMGFFFGGFTGSNRPMVSYDTLCGYRITPGEHRVMSISGGELEYDHISTANAQGWYSSRNYVPGKKTKKRYMVLGDSYSSGLSVSRTWIDEVQDRLAARGNDSVELYNFSQDGAGLVNWYRIFRYEIVPRYAFDGIIIAASSEKDGVPNLDRNFMLAQSYADMNYMAVLDPDKEAVPPQFDRRRAIPITPVCDNAEMDRIRETYRTPSFTPQFRYHTPDLYFLKIMHRLGNGVYNLFYFLRHMQGYHEPYARYEALAGQPYRAEWFTARYRRAYMLSYMLQHCRRRGKEMIWVTVPDRENALEYVQGHDIIYRNEALSMTGRYGIRYCDGYTIFSGKDEAFVRNHYYRYDGHLNADGIHRLSATVADTLFGP